jgi:hypothetical protein
MGVQLEKEWYDALVSLDGLIVPNAREIGRVGLETSLGENTELLVGSKRPTLLEVTIATWESVMYKTNCEQNYK